MVAAIPRKPSDMSLLDVATGFGLGISIMLTHQIIFIIRLRLELRKRAMDLPHA